MNNLLTNLPRDQREESFEPLLAGGAFRAERIVSLGHATPPDQWYDQASDEWVVVLSGSARLRFEHREELLELRPGDYVNIPARQRHRVEWTDPQTPTVWLAIHYEPREDGKAINEATG